MQRFLNAVKSRFSRRRKSKSQAQGSTTPAPAPPKEDVSRQAEQPSESAVPPPAAPEALHKPLPVARAASTTGTLAIKFQNNTQSSTVYAYITGTAIDNNYSLFLLQADGRTPYYPQSPANVQTPLQANCAIPLGAPGNSTTVTIPRIAGGRIWFSVDSPLTFLLNPGPALVEPSVTNPSDPNINKNWSFAEFTFNEAQLYANISFVDFVALPIALNLSTASGATQTIQGLPSGGLNTIINQLRQQTATDGVNGWQNLIQYSPSGQPLRVLSPTLGIIVHPNDFSGYYDPFTNAVLSTYQSRTLQLQTYKSYTGRTTNQTITIGTQSFTRPSTFDIFSSNTGPFATGADTERNTIIPQLAAAFNRSTLLASSSVPAPLSAFYANAITNHYSRIVHGVVTAGKGYAFPYDDVPPADGGDQSGYVSAGDPTNLTVTIGGL